MALTSVWLTKASHLPSGDQAGEWSEPRLVVMRVRFAPLSVLPAATTQTSLLKLRSGSGVLRLLVKARDLPSGDQEGSESSKSPLVTWVDFFEATSKMYRWSRRR